MSQKNPSEPSQNSNEQRRGDLSLGLQFALTAFLGMALGFWLDKKWGTSPWGFLGGFFFGAFAGMFNLARHMK